MMVYLCRASAITSVLIALIVSEANLALLNVPRAVELSVP